MRAERLSREPPSTVRKARPAGRPKFFGEDELREVWLHVEEAKARTGRSANEVCGERPLTWFNVGRGGPKRIRCSAENTLLRRYQEACRLLQDEREEREALRQALRVAGASAPWADEQLSIAAWWNAELRRRLAVND